ncbi:MAG: serine/threonine protein kinase [Deltaproteobacteria bacterium]|jgi:serine/threonine-protein kinase|nr:serine/threonine protein kinase [Deltaproteobacteria bacterium]
MRDFNDLVATFSNVSPLARGGQKIVYSATHPKHGEIVLKLFLKTDARSQREIDISREVDFDCVPKIFDIGHVNYVGSDTLYVIERRINGQDLRNRLIHEERFTLKEAVGFLERGLSFIQRLEKKKIVHCDLKPENIILSADGKAWFLDFGIARTLGAPSLTKLGELISPRSPGYAAPEQYNNLKNYIDSRADLFSIGVVTYECLTGENPFRTGAVSSLDILQRTETITPFSFQIPGDTQRRFMGLLSSLMGKYPSRRPNNATQALAWLSGTLSTLQYKDGNI